MLHYISTSHNSCQWQMQWRCKGAEQWKWKSVIISLQKSYYIFGFILGRKKIKCQVFSSSPPGDHVDHQRGDTYWQAFSSMCFPTFILLLVWCSTGDESGESGNRHVSLLPLDKNLEMTSCEELWQVKVMKNNQIQFINKLIPVGIKRKRQQTTTKTFALWEYTKQRLYFLMSNNKISKVRSLREKKLWHIQNINNNNILNISVS